MKKALLAILLFAAPAYGQQAAIRYVSETGKDSNDGLSWRGSKATVFAALVSLPGGNATGPLAGSGTVYVAPRSSANPTSNAGIWLMAPSDPNYSNPPAGWLQCNGCTINIIGMPNQSGGPNGHKPLASIVAGGNQNNNQPAIWLSGTQQSQHFSNLGFAYPGRAVVIGECSNNARSGCGVTGVVLESVSSLIMNRPTSGPCTDITGGSFWIWLRDYGCGGNAYKAAGGRFANNAAAVLIDGTGNSGNGLIHINDSNLAGGGIKFIPGANGGSLYVSNITEEGLGDRVHDIPPVVWFTGFGGAVDAYLSNIQMADGGPTPTPAIQNDGGGPGPTVANTTGGGGIRGPATVLNQNGQNFTAQGISPVLSRQTGFFNGYMVGETDSARRIAGFVPVRFKNLAVSNSSSWVATQYSGATTLSTGQSDPFGGTSATKASSTTAINEGMYFSKACQATQYTPNAGDWIIAGAWIKGDSRTTIQGLGLSFCGYPQPTFSNKVYQQGMLQGDGQWSWQWLAYKVSGGPATHFSLYCQFSTSPVTAYGPVLYIIPSGTISDDEALEFASTMASVDSACPVGSICNMPGHPLVTIQ
jgi:hypothetical protein